MTEQEESGSLESLGLTKDAVLDFFATLPKNGLIFHGVKNANYSVQEIRENGLTNSYVRMLNPQLDKNPELRTLLEKRDAKGLLNALIRRIRSGEYVGAKSLTIDVALVVAQFPQYTELEGTYREIPSRFPQPIKGGSGFISTTPEDIKEIFIRKVSEPATVFAQRVVTDLIINRKKYNTNRQTELKYLNL